MPELPEVETLCRQLQACIACKKIRSTTVFDSKLDEIENLRGRIIQEVKRAGKTIVIHLDDDRSIAIHLRMTGRLFWQQGGNRLPHTRWRINLENGNIDLIDPRRFATVKVIKTEAEKSLNDLISGFDEKKFLATEARRKVNIKALLMDSRALAGIGNIYACEILHRTGVSPFKKASALSKARWKAIFSEARVILKSAIEKRGTSISDWRDLYGCPGENQHELQAYGRESEVCRKCGGLITRIRQGSRSTFYCSKCQR
jgi:formamidopyrimidine-DNA glycosylase